VPKDQIQHAERASHQHGWPQLIAGFPWFEGEGRYPIQAYSEFMPPPRLGRTAYGEIDDLLFAESDPYGWHISEIEEEYELRPGLDHLAQQIMAALMRLGQAETEHAIAGHQGRNLENNPYWPPELAVRAGQLKHERYVILLPLALSRTQDDMGRVRWTFFGGSEQGPERAFWKSFYTTPDQEQSTRESLSLMYRLLSIVYGETATNQSQLRHAGFRILPSESHERFPHWIDVSIPSWTQAFIVDDKASYDDVRYLLTFRPFSHLPAAVRERYLAGKLHLLPFPGSLVFWGMPTYLRLQAELPFAIQIPLLRLAERRGGPDGIRVPQSGWVHDPHPSVKPSEVQPALIRDTFRRTHRWNRVHRYDDELAQNPRVDKVTKVLFSTALDVLDLYNKPMARNSQLWTKDHALLLDGPNATRAQLGKAEAALTAGGLFGYRFQYPAMRVGLHEVYWHRPLVAYWSRRRKRCEVLPDAMLGYLTAYRTDALDLAHPIELWPRLLRREMHLLALLRFRRHDHYAHQTSLDILSLLDNWRLLGQQPLRRSFAQQLLRIAKSESLDAWLNALPQHAVKTAEGHLAQKRLARILASSKKAEGLPELITYRETATRAFEEAFWNEILHLSHGRYVNKDNADVVQDKITLSAVPHHQRDLEQLGDYLMSRYRRAIAESAMDGEAVCGDLPFQWRTDFDFALFGGWKDNQEKQSQERDILIVIPGKDHTQAIVFADHYDTAYMEDIYEQSRGGSGARMAAAGADDDHSATATLLLAAPLFLKLAKEGRLERDIWLLHLTGEEFPADCLGARHFSQMLIEKDLKLRLHEDKWMDLSQTQVLGIYVMDMIAHNRDNAQDIFQISPGRSRASLDLAWQAHIANMLWNAHVDEWNEHPERKGKQRGKRSADAMTIPEIALHPKLSGEVRTIDDPQSSLYNTDGQIFSDIGAPTVLFMENYDINRVGYHDTHDTMANIDLDYGAAFAAIAIETIARCATQKDLKYAAT
jgi:peptidase M28-like protein